MLINTFHSDSSLSREPSCLLAIVIWFIRKLEASSQTDKPKRKHNTKLILDKQNLVLGNNPHLLPHSHTRTAQSNSHAVHSLAKRMR